MGILIDFMASMECMGMTDKFRRMNIVRVFCRKELCMQNICILIEENAIQTGGK